MGLTPEKQAILSDIYHDFTQPEGLGGVDLLYKRARGHGITRTEVVDFLRSNNVYTLHRLPRVKFPRLPILSPRPGCFLAADLGDMSSLAKHNRGFKYLLVAVDIFSRFLQVRPMKTKTGKETAKALESILDKPLTGSIRRIHVDSGGEFYNKHVKALMQDRKIKIYSTFSQEIKSSLAERHLQTLKRIIYKYLTLKSTFKYIDVLQTLVDKYNNTPHRGLGNGKSPIFVHGLKKLKDVRRQFNDMYRRGYKRAPLPPSKHCYRVGQTVRVSRDSRTKPFYKGYHARFNEEYFTVNEVIDTGRVPVYILRDLNGEVLKGVFYSQELIPSTPPVDVFPLRVLRTKGKGENKKFYVTWVGYPDSFNCWIDKGSLENG